VRVRLSRRVVAAGLSLAAVSGVAAVVWWRTANIGAVQRGADLVVANGCLGCHGGASLSPVLPRPFAEPDDVEPATLREWILDGMPQRVRQDPESRMALEAEAIRMPAWRGRLSQAQVDDLVTYMRAVAAADVPEDPAARNGYAIAERLGCFLAATALAGVARAAIRGASRDTSRHGTVPISRSSSQTTAS
jgi:mono/diheme cytochrome c family protein